MDLAGITELIFSPELYWGVLETMCVLAPIVFICLLKVTAGYGMMYTPAWGPVVNNRTGWILMEAPVFIAMCLLWAMSGRRSEVVPAVMCLFFLIHYFQRSFVFPLLLRGKGRMPLTIVAMGVVFNLINAYLIGGWLFYVSPADYYPVSWFLDPRFIIGTVVFFTGMYVNIRSDSIVRNLRKRGDTCHYIPRGGMYRYVTSANYFGELLEWTGFALLTWSAAGVVFVIWTFANLAPRAGKIHLRYLDEFGEEYRRLNRKRIIPFIY